MFQKNPGYKNTRSSEYGNKNEYYTVLRDAAKAKQQENPPEPKREEADLVKNPGYKNLNSSGLRQ